MLVGRECPADRCHIHADRIAPIDIKLRRGDTSDLDI